MLLGRWAGDFAGGLICGALRQSIRFLALLMITPPRQRSPGEVVEALSRGHIECDLDEDFLAPQASRRKPSGRGVGV